MRILHLTPELPYWPGGSGGATRQFHLLRRLVELGHEVAVVAPATASQLQHADVLAAAGIHAELHPRPPSRSREALEALRGEPLLAARAASWPVLAWQVGVFWHHLRPLAGGLVAEWRPDVLSVEHDYSAPWAADLPGTLPAALTFQNVSWRYYRTRAAAAPGLRRPALALEAARFRRFDARQLERYGAAIAMSDADADELRSLGAAQVSVVPNGVATDELEPLADVDSPPTVLFTGTLAYPPNAEGILWFVERAWPSVRRELPEARLVVAGRDPPPAVLALRGREGIDLAGFVPDLRSVFERATIAIVPLLSGSGTRLKALEAMAWGRGLVSTSIGVEGLEVVPGEHVLVEDDPDAFGAAVVALLRDRGLRERLAGAGRRLTEERYDWRLLGERLAAVLERLAP